MNQRKSKADFIKQLRASLTSCSNSTIKHLAAVMYGFPPKPTLGDYYPVYKHLGCLRSVKSDEDGSWHAVILCQGELTKDDVDFLAPSFCGGAGRSYAKKASFEFNGHSTIIRQRGGLDI